MTTAIYLIISGVLIGAGISIIWRDIQKKRRGAFVSARDARHRRRSRVEITIAHGAGRSGPRAPCRRRREPVPLRAVDEPDASLASSVQASRHAESVRYGGALPVARGEGQRSPARLRDPSRGGVDRGGSDGVACCPTPAAARRPPRTPPRQGARLALEQQWSVLQPAIAAGVERTNAVLAPVRLFDRPRGGAVLELQEQGLRRLSPPAPGRAKAWRGSGSSCSPTVSCAPASRRTGRPGQRSMPRADAAGAGSRRRPRQPICFPNASSRRRPMPRASCATATRRRASRPGRASTAWSLPR